MDKLAKAAETILYLKKLIKSVDYVLLMGVRRVTCKLFNCFFKDVHTLYYRVVVLIQWKLGIFTGRMYVRCTICSRDT